MIKLWSDQNSRILNCSIDWKRKEKDKSKIFVIIGQILERTRVSAINVWKRDTSVDYMTVSFFVLSNLDEIIYYITKVQICGSWILLWGTSDSFVVSVVSDIYEIGLLARD